MVTSWQPDHYLTGALAGSIRASVQLAWAYQRDFPYFVSSTGPYTKLGLDNPDTLYFHSYLRERDPGVANWLQCTGHRRGCTRRVRRPPPGRRTAMRSPTSGSPMIRSMSASVSVRACTARPCGRRVSASRG